MTFKIGDTVRLKTDSGRYEHKRGEEAVITDEKHWNAHHMGWLVCRFKKGNQVVYGIHKEDKDFEKVNKSLKNILGDMK